MTKLAVIYYSATGHGTKMAQQIEKFAQAAGAEVRVRHIAEQADPSVFAENPAWSANYEATKDLETEPVEPVAPIEPVKPVDPALTTVRQPFRELGALCLEVLLGAIEGAEGSRHSIPPSLRVRRTSA